MYNVQQKSSHCSRHIGKVKDCITIQNYDSICEMIHTRNCKCFPCPFWSFRPRYRIQGRRMRAIINNFCVPRPCYRYSVVALYSFLFTLGSADSCSSTSWLHPISCVRLRRRSNAKCFDFFFLFRKKVLFCEKWTLRANKRIILPQCVCSTKVQLFFTFYDQHKYSSLCS